MRSLRSLWSRSRTWKHSQYFFLQFDFLQLQPERCADTAVAPRGAILGSNALGFRASMVFRASSTPTLQGRQPG